MKGKLYGIANKLFRAAWRFHQFDNCAVCMNYLVIAFAVYLLVGCSTIRYAENGVEFSRTSFGTMTQISEFTVSRDQSGRITFGMKGYQSDQVQAIGAVAEGVAKGLVATVKP